MEPFRDIEVVYALDDSLHMMKGLEPYEIEEDEEPMLELDLGN